MDISEAKYVMEQPYLIHVKYRGIPVYIQEVHEEDGTATVFPLDNMEHVQVVDLDGLYEDNPIH